MEDAKNRDSNAVASKEEEDEVHKKDEGCMFV